MGINFTSHALLFELELEGDGRISDDYGPNTFDEHLDFREQNTSGSITDA